MTEQEITDIKEYMAKNKEEGGRIENAFKDGEAIRVTGSSFMGLEGRVIRIDNEQGKANVVLQVFGRETSVESSTRPTSSGLQAKLCHWHRPGRPGRDCLLR